MKISVQLFVTMSFFFRGELLCSFVIFIDLCCLSFLVNDVETCFKCILLLICDGC